MKDTHTMTQIEELMYEYFNRIQNSETKEEKRALLKKLKPLETHWRDINSKHINGKKYPERMKGFPDDKPMNVKEVLKLIDSVDVVEDMLDDYPRIEGLDVSGGSPVPGVNRFKFEDKGWSKAKEMKPVNLFK